jgi:hypothetical protein
MSVQDMQSEASLQATMAIAARVWRHVASVRGVIFQT